MIHSTLFHKQDKKILVQMTPERIEKRPHVRIFTSSKIQAFSCRVPTFQNKKAQNAPHRIQILVRLYLRSHNLQAPDNIK
jgi:hypothetical protein